MRSSALIMLEKPTEDGHDLRLPILSTDVLIQIQSFLDPKDILSLRKTSRVLYATSKIRIVWINALQRVCYTDGISLSTFHPIENLSPIELENAAFSPFRFVNRLDASITAGENIRPLTTRVLVPDLLPLTPTESMDIPFDCYSIFLVPGGRFMLADTADHGLCLWDLGIHPGSPINQSPLAVLHKASGELTRFTSPTPDAHGVYICIAGET
ncbi:uncharacterized protein LACBIDRAFT_306758 [Laccaria bicolor S238N-H82]|uniref:Predicted protein n=1 Tax=Laccaria bicolor (strain S238N-H82 / ATCC MYA-4686) TaxID=486041 RepID=B0DNM2_LACBS|nr:uncharacterized protein LACBIDRAFT_306758 [Laccaria bicolor S238N-H82]EDR03744.1 predicted protein [Laccaria bicolor S238N-H82]|eukprot:XP_001885597.1 predicted protein [Laccaria bicolor S238N-H82]